MNPQGESPSAIARFLKEVDQLVSRIDLDSATMLSGVAEVTGGVSRNGHCTLEISADRMTATAEFFPAFGQGLALTRDEFLGQIRTQGIVHGVVVGEGALPTSGKQVVATGTPAIDASAQAIEVAEELLTKRLLFDARVRSFDFKTQSSFVQVHRGDLLTRTIPAQVGVCGQDLEGRSVPFHERPVMSPRAGKNVLAGSSGYTAACDGNFRSERGMFWVDKILRLEFGVGYDTGHIDFDGDVRLEGEIAAGFSIRTEGSLQSTCTIDVTEIVCGGDVSTPQGIIGRPGATLEAGGPIRAKFLEATFVRTQAPLEIIASVLNCHIQTLDRLVMGPKGLLLGGQTEAMNGIDVFQIGNLHGIPSEVQCGTDYTVIDKMEWARTQSLSLVKQLRTLERHRQAHPSQETTLALACGKVRDQVLKLNELSRRLVSLVDRNEGAEVVVRGTAHIGATISICRARLKIAKPVSGVKFFLDKTLGAITEARL